MNLRNPFKRSIFILALVLSCFMSIPSMAKLEAVDGDGRFYSRDEDTLSFIKKQLLSEAFKDVFTKELKKLGLDSEKFWRSFEEKFSEYYHPIKDSLEKKHGVSDGNTNSAFKKEERLKRLSLQSRYGALSRAIPQYSIKKMSRSTQVPNSRYISIKAKVDPKEIHRIFLQFTRNAKQKNYTTLYITVNYELIKASWLDTGVEVKSDFTQVLEKEWRSKLKGFLGDGVGQIVYTDESMARELTQYTRIHHEAISEIESDQKGSISSGGPDYGDSLWLKMNFSLKKVGESVQKMKRTFEVSGDMILQSLSTREIIAFDDFGQLNKELSYEDKKSLSSTLASSIYQMPMVQFKKINSSIMHSAQGLKKVELSILDYENLADVNYLIKMLSEKGITKQFNPAINSFGQNDAKILLEYSGEDEDMLSIIKSLSGTQINGNKVLVFPEVDQFFRMSLLNPIQAQEAQKEKQEKKLQQKSLQEQQTQVEES